MVAINGFTKLVSESLDGVKRINIMTNVDFVIKSIRGINQLQAILVGNACADQSSISIKRVGENLDIEPKIRLSPVYIKDNGVDYQIPPTMIGLRLEIQIPEYDEVLRDFVITSLNGNICIERGVQCNILQINSGTSNIWMYGSVSKLILRGNSVTFVGDIIATSDINLDISIYTGCVKLTVDDIIESNVFANTTFGIIDGAIKGDPSGRFKANGKIQLFAGPMILR